MVRDGLSVDFIGRLEVSVVDAEGKVLRTREYHNLWTDQCRERILRTLLQVTGGGNMLNATSYCAKLAFCTGALPTNPRSDDLGTVQDYENFNTLADITSGTSSCYGTKTASWLNGTGSTVTITYLAAVYTNAVAASNVYTIVDIEDEDVENGQTITVNYTWQVNFGTSQEV